MTLAAFELDFGHSLATCPACPQNMHSLFVKRHVLSSVVSFPSFPNLLSRSDFCCCCPELPDLLEELPEDFSGFLTLFELLLELELELELEHQEIGFKMIINYNHRSVI